jgi:non-specific serine/threonine protein kinase
MNNGPGPFAVLLQRYRLAAGLSQEELSKHAELSRRGISDLERGARRTPHPATVRRLAAALQLDATDRELLLASSRRPQTAHGPVGTPPRTSLPIPLTSFIGRGRELAEVRRLLGTARLLTLTGTGGVGKTRLALQVVVEQPGEDVERVWFIDLAPLADGLLVVPAIAAVLGVREESTRPLVETLADVLGLGPGLLVLDNCEHVVEACVMLADRLLRANLDLRILATSREPFRIAGETVWRVPSLAVPDQMPGRLDELGQIEAVRLFVERAMAARPSFRLTEQNAAAITELCGRLDGIPLALELAAARVPMLPVEQLVARLDNHLRLLSVGNRLMPSRQQTLRAAIQWSYNLLSEPERRLFARLSVFAGGWSLEAAEAVCGGEALAPGGVLDLLGRLVDKSLVQVEEDGGEARFRLLETLRYYARERLQDLGEVPSTCDRHADFFLQLAEAAEPHLWGPSLMNWLARGQREHDNLRAALAWCLEHDRAEQGLRLAGALARFWLSRGHLSEGREWLRRLLLLPEDGTHALARATAVSGAALLADYQGDGPATRALAVEAVTRARTLGDKRLLGMALAPMGSSLFAHGDFPAACAAYEEGIAVSRAACDPALEALNTLMLGRSLHAQGQVAAARECYEAALRLTREAGFARLHPRVLLYLGLLSHEQGELEAARGYLRESLARGRAVEDKVESARVLISLARLAVDDHDLASAWQHLTDAVALGRELGRRDFLARCASASARLLAAQGRPQEALQLVGAASQWYQARSLPIHPDIKLDLSWGLAVARELLDEPEIESALEVGRAVSLDQAIAAGLDQLRPGHAGISSSTATRRALATVKTPPPQASQPSGGSRQRDTTLSPRERQVALLLAEGLTNRQISEQLVVTQRTVASHIEHILEKLGFASRHQVGVWAAERGWQHEVRDSHR